MIGAIIAGALLLYVVMIGVGWQIGGAHWNGPGPFFIGALWPVALPAMIGCAHRSRSSNAADWLT